MSKKMILLISALLALGLVSTAGAADPSLLGWYRFEGNANDSSDYANHGTAQGGPLWISGLPGYGGAIRFDGVNDYVGTGKILLANVSQFTLAGWVSAGNPTASRIGLFGQNDVIEMGFNGGNISIWISAGGATTQTPWTFPNLTWHHVAVVADTSMRIYLDGQLAVTGTGAANYGTSTYPFNIGGGGIWDTTGNWFSGSMDEVRVYNRALTQAEVQALAVHHEATNPSPPDGSEVNADVVSLAWGPAASAALHDVYFSDNFDDVNTADSSDPMGPDKVYKARQTELKYPPGEWDTIPLTRGLTYYWRIDEVNGVNTCRGNIWSFTAVPNLNYNPTPAHQATYVPVTTDLSWIKGNLAKKGHIVYYSTSFDIVNNAVPGTTTGTPGYLAPTSPQTAASLIRTIPGDLLYNTTYYWRADAVENTPPTTPGNTHKGTIWQFKTGMPGTGSILRELWTGITPTDSTTIDALYNWPAFPSSPTSSVTIPSFDTEPALDQYGGRIHGWVYAPASGDYTFYLATDDNGELWLSTDDNPANAQLIAYETVWAGPRAWQTGAEMSAPIPLVGDKKYYISALWKEGNGGDNCAVGWTGPGISAITVIPGDVLMPFVQYWAYDPIPANEAYNVSATPTLDWLAGRYAASHNVYFGTVYADVKAGTGGTFKGNQPLGDTDYVPSPALEAGKLYYWKITEVNDLHADKKWEGPVWVFRVAGGAGGLLGAYYQEPGAGAAPAAFETFKLSRIDPEINFGWGNGSPDPLVDVNDFSCRWTGQVEAEFSEDYTFYTLVDDGERLWVDGQLVINQWVQGATPEYVSVPIPFVAGQKYDIVMEQYENEGGAAAYLRWSSPSVSKRIIPPIWLWPPTKATNPVPPDGSTDAPCQQLTLSWTAGVYAAAANGHKVYFDADQAKVIARAGCQVNGTSTTNPSYLLLSSFGLEETYYWAVDEVNGVNSWPGDVWSFTTANNKVIDDMELYPPNVQDSNIYQVWIDGAGDCGSIAGNNSGALVDIATVGAPAPVHGGQQAMKLVYDNDGTVDNPCPPGLPTARLTYSKVEAQVAQLPSGVGSDWTVGGVAKMLSLWFYGDPLNSIEPMWVQLTDASNNKFKVFYGAYADEDVNDMNDVTSWHEWLIDLADFTGVSVNNVKSIAIGVGNEGGPAGGSGTLYFDDIRLYTPQCVLTRRPADFAAFDYAPAGNPAGDCLIDYRELELMTQDWLLNDYNVTGDANLINFPTDNSQWVAGKNNNALNFDGINDHVYAQRIYLPRSAFSVAMWINPRIDLGPTTRRMDLIYWGVGNRPHLTFNKTEGTDGAIALWPNTGAADFDGPQTVTTSWTANTWYHIAATFDGIDFKIYVNGVGEGTVNHPGTHSAASGPRIGSNNAGANNFDGRIDDFRIYAYALPASDVGKLANQTGEPAAGPLFRLKFDETSGGIAHESVGTLIYVPLPRPGIDVYADGTIDFKDYAVEVTRWLEEDLYP